MAHSTSSTTIKVISNAGEVKKEIMDALRKGMTIIGIQAESYAKQACPVDTGLLRNSITYAIGGEVTHIGSYADDKGGNPGKYEGSAPADEEGVITLYVGTNVSYAPCVELGHAQQPGRYVPAIGKRLKASFVQGKPFLRQAMEGHAQEYHTILSNELNKIK